MQDHNSVLLLYIPREAYPSVSQTAPAVLELGNELHIVPHSPSIHTSTVP